MFSLVDIPLLLLSLLVRDMKFEREINIKLIKRASGHIQSMTIDAYTKLILLTKILPDISYNAIGIM